MSRYSKDQEDRMEAKMVTLGFEVVEDTARRKQYKGDRVLRHKDSGIEFTIDHKSTTGKEMITFKKAWMEKIEKESVVMSIPAVTLSFKGSHKLYMVIDVEYLLSFLY